MTTVLGKWNQSLGYRTAFKYKAAAAHGSVEDGIQTMNAEDSSLLSKDRDDGGIILPIQEPRQRRLYSLVVVVALFGFGIFLGSLVPLRISRHTYPRSFVPRRMFCSTIAPVDLKLTARLVPTTEYIFQEFTSFGTMSEDMGNASWASILPRKAVTSQLVSLKVNMQIARNGMIQIDSPEKYDLPPGLPLYSNRNPPTAIRKKYALSVFHQLHCIQMLRGEYLSHLKGDSQGKPHVSAEAGHEHHERMHLEHCFDYLRQSLMCSADTTVEWANPHAGPTQKPLIDGWNIKHKECKNWDSVLQFVADHAAPVVVD